MTEVEKLLGKPDRVENYPQQALQAWIYPAEGLRVWCIWKAAPATVPRLPWKRSHGCLRPVVYPNACALIAMCGCGEPERATAILRRWYVS